MLKKCEAINCKSKQKIKQRCVGQLLLHYFLTRVTSCTAHYLAGRTHNSLTLYSNVTKIILHKCSIQCTTSYFRACHLHSSSRRVGFKKTCLPFFRRRWRVFLRRTGVLFPLMSALLVAREREMTRSKQLQFLSFFCPQKPRFVLSLVA